MRLSYAPGCRLHPVELTVADLSAVCYTFLRTLAMMIRKISSPRRLHREGVPTDTVVPIIIREIHPPSRFCWHYRPEVELLLVVAGRGLRFVIDSIQEYHEGELYLLGPNVPHCWFTRPEPGRTADTWLVLQFVPEILD